LPLAPVLATAQVKPGETQEEEANSGEVIEMPFPYPHIINMLSGRLDMKAHFL
jgi:hypothetical protein